MVCMPKEMGQLHRARGGEGRGGEAARPVAEVPEGPVGLLLPGGLHRHVVLVAQLRAEGPEGGGLGRPAALSHGLNFGGTSLNARQPRAKNVFNDVHLCQGCF